MFGGILDRTFVAFKHMRPIWRAATKVEKLFYQSGYRTVVEANAFALAGDRERAKALLSGPIADYVKPAAELVMANLAITDESAWLDHLNRYVAPFGLAPIILRNGSNRLGQLATKPVNLLQDGPMITIIMAVHNAAKTLRMAAGSILSQSWVRLQLIIVDDASTDGSGAIAEDIAQGDERVVVLHLPVNCGPYVCRNIALRYGNVRGKLLTCHDADDWAHPQRLEFHYAAANAAGVLDTASLSGCLRMRADGTFASIAEARPRSPDGALHVANVSCLFNTAFLREKLGYWDCVKFSGDSEMIGRATKSAGKSLKRFPQLSMICYDSEQTLSGHPELGGNPVRGLSPTRWEYRKAYEKWHAGMKDQCYLDFPPDVADFGRPGVIVVDRVRIDKVLDRIRLA